MTPHESVAQRPPGKSIARACITAAPGSRSGIRSPHGRGQRHRSGSAQEARGTSRRTTAGSDDACRAQRRAKGTGRYRGVAAPMTAMGCLGAQDWDSTLAAAQESHSSCTDSKAEVNAVDSTTRQETCGKLTTSSRKPKVGKRPRTTGNGCTDTARTQRRLKTVEGLRHKPQTLEEPCAGKLASTVVKQRRGERFPRLL